MTSKASKFSPVIEASHSYTWFDAYSCRHALHENSIEPPQESVTPSPKLKFYSTVLSFTQYMVFRTQNVQVIVKKVLRARDTSICVLISSTLHMY